MKAFRAIAGQRESGASILTTASLAGEIATFLSLRKYECLIAGITAELQV